MRILGALIILLFAIGGATWEWIWRMDHAANGVSVPSASGSYVAQIRSLPEGSVVPYGQGVFIRHRDIPLWVTSTLVFAGYCKPEISLHWRSPKELAVECVIAEGTPKVLPAPSGIVVTHSRGGS